MGRRSRKQGGGFLTVLIVVFVGWYLVGQLRSDGDGEERPVAASGGQASSYALDFSRSWPPLLDDEAVVVADNPTAANYYIVLDGSGSMEESRCSGRLSKMAAAKAAVASFAAQIPPDANVGLAVFDGGGLSERAPLRGGARTDFQAEVMRVRAQGGTPLASAVALGYEALTQQARRQLGYGEYHLVVITDGEANEGQEPDRMVNAVLAESPVVIHTIGFCIGDRHSLNQPGRIDYRAADDPAALERGLTAVLAESPDFTVTDF